MGLDVYVGTFHRYFSGEWETIMQQHGREMGFDVQVFRPDTRSLLARIRDWFRPEPDLPAEIEAWKRRLSQIAGTEVRWNEHPDADYYTDKPNWDGYGALLLWAAYAEGGSSDLPATAAGWSTDPVLDSCQGNRESRFPHLLWNTQVWLPGEFLPFLGPHPGSDDVVFGSVNALLRELTDLNESTWSASGDDLSHWRREGPDPEDSLERSARFGLSIFFQLAELASQHRLPMKLDY